MNKKITIGAKPTTQQPLASAEEWVSNRAMQPA